MNADEYRRMNMSQGLRHEDLNAEEGRKEFRLSDDERLRDVSIFPIRVREGDDASCLNLNQSLTPPLLGIDPDALIELGAAGVLKAVSDQTSGNIEVRVTVETPTVWGWVGIIIILAVIAGVIFIFMRFSRR